MNKQVSLGSLSKISLSSMKLPKGISIRQIVLIVVAIALLALAIYFAISYFSAAGNRTDLNGDIRLKQQQINQVGGLQNIGALQSQLEEAQQDLIDENPFPLEVDNIDVVYQILQAAADANVVCFQYSSAGKASFDINGHTYKSNSYSISSSGVGSTGVKLTRIIRFLKNIEELPYNAVRISGLSFQRGSDEGTWVSSFSLIIISQQ